MKCVQQITITSQDESISSYDLIFIEDSYNEALILDSILKKMDPMPNCGWINSAEVALGLLEKKLFPQTKVVFLDIRMPNINGLECLEKMRNTFNYTQSPIVMLSSSDHHKDIERAYALKCSSYIVKDNNLLDFREKISTTIRYWVQLNTFN